MLGNKNGAVSMVMIIFVLLTLTFAGTTYWMYTESEEAKLNEYTRESKWLPSKRPPLNLACASISTHHSL